tara:strand:+ start:334 stop:597 length:264 start_codon:yes stop_codon:yes gene_type:complete
VEAQEVQEQEWGWGRRRGVGAAVHSPGCRPLEILLHLYLEAVPATPRMELIVVEEAQIPIAARRRPTPARVMGLFFLHNKPGRNSKR